MKTMREQCLTESNISAVQHLKVTQKIWLKYWFEDWYLAAKTKIWGNIAVSSILFMDCIPPNYRKCGSKNEKINSRILRDWINLIQKHYKKGTIKWINLFSGEIIKWSFRAEHRNYLDMKQRNKYNFLWYFIIHCDSIKIDLRWAWNQ